MENNENNNLSELDQLKAQYETLKQQFDQQEIVNDRLMKSSIRHSADFYKRYRWMQIVLYPLAAVSGLFLIKWRLDNNLSARLFWVTFCVVCFVIELLMTRKLQVKTLENNDLLALSNHARNFKKLFSIFTISNYSTGIILVMGLLLAWMGKGVPNLRAAMVVFCIAIIILIVIGIAEIRYKTRPCDEIISQIEAFEAPMDKKSGFDKRQKWFCVAMIVAFIGLDVWAYTIVGSRLKLPLMWQTKEYVRAAEDLSTEGKLEIWEIAADTLVAEEDVSAVMKWWQQSDSLVLMTARNSNVAVGMDEESTHAWKENEVQQVRLYALKKTTSEGPAISSAVLDGKPMVAYAVFTHPHKFRNAEPVPIFVFLTSEARQLWYQFTTKITGHRTAIVMDGVVIQDWQVMCGIDNGKFMITREWSSKEEVEAFCKQLIKQ